MVPLSSEVHAILGRVDLAICLVFLADFFVNLKIAENKLGYLRWGWIDFISSIPAIDTLRWGRLARVVRIVRFLRSLKSVRVLWRALDRSRIESLTLLLASATLLVYTLSSCLIIEFEREYDGSSLSDPAVPSGGPS